MTITSAEYGRMEKVISVLRQRIQRAREALERGAVAQALQLLKIEYDDEVSPNEL